MTGFMSGIADFLVEVFGILSLSGMFNMGVACFIAEVAVFIRVAGSSI
jgi:hypothetical protein